ncbi:MAG: metallophosphoesterase [Bacillota bacterium]|nr:metallophosphoesterase [Bacillota bacterium]
MLKAVKSILKFILLYILMTAVIITSLVFYIRFDDKTIDVTNYEIYSQKLPPSFEGYKIMLLSDYHDAYYYEKVADKIKKSHPDVIFLLGDMCNNGDKGTANTEKLLGLIQNTAPIYGITGNHEEYATKVQSLLDKFRKYNVKYLLGESAELTKGNSSILVYGLRDTYLSDQEIENDPNWLKNNMDALSKNLNTNRFNILLMHRASLFPEITSYGYDAVFSGHMHGGIIRLPFVGGLVSESGTRFFPEYTKGLYTKGSTKMVVSRGLDYDKSRVRIFNGPELVLVTLRK